jgi:predicted RNA-binding protein YlxR (DUF448 family)
MNVVGQLAQNRRHIPLRSCVVCRTTSDKRALLRVVRLPEREGGLVVVDPSGKRSGRGAYVCPSPACIDAAQKQKRFQTALAAPAGSISADIYVELKELAAASSNDHSSPAQS